MDNTKKDLLTRELVDLDKDFTNKPFAKQENRCNANLSHPLKKIAK